MNWGLGKAYKRHDFFTQIRVCVSPRGAVLDDFVSASSAELGHHQGRRSGGNDDGASQPEGAGRVDSGETSIAAAGGEDVRLRADR